MLVECILGPESREKKIQRKEGRNSIPAITTTPPFVREGKGPS